MGPLSVLSFGRGKGLTGSGGGALLAVGAHGRELLDAVRAPAPARGDARTLASAVAQWALGRPGLYALPASIPALHLGETIYHPAHEPRAITAVSASLVRDALTRAHADLLARARNAQELSLAAAAAKGVRSISPLPGASPGYLRLPIRVDASRADAPALGVVRGYPETLTALAELQPSLAGDEKLSGSAELARTIVTLPTHAMLTSRDRKKIVEWMVD
jgi:dTDP-4-amino-4,6-dideoxygalactose transaminase